jgi:ABC-2 type transport system permease protein
VTDAVPGTEAPRARPSYATVIWGLVLRDSRVLGRTLIPFVSRTIMNPLLFVFVFTYVFPRIGQGFQSGVTGSSFATVLVPGLVAVGMVFQGIAAVALPLSIELGGRSRPTSRSRAGHCWC